MRVIFMGQVMFLKKHSSYITYNPNVFLHINVFTPSSPLK